MGKQFKASLLVSPERPRLLDSWSLASARPWISLEQIRFENVERPSRITWLNQHSISYFNRLNYCKTQQS